jgi:hypothetical protein
MTTFGKTIKIYLKDGTVTGIRFGEVVNQTILSIACPRNRVTELKPYEEANKPGVYFLFGIDEQTGDNKAYIGESENVYERLQSHLATKEFWNEVIFFVSKDENLTKSHVKYLESTIIQIAKSTQRYIIENGNQSQASSLPAADKDAMEEFLTYIKLLLGVFGHKFLEELNPDKVQVINPQNLQPSTALLQSSSIATNDEIIELTISTAEIKAKAFQTDEGIVVVQGSDARKNFDKKNTPRGYGELRDRLISNGTLIPNNDKLIFNRNYPFTASSPAASIILGYNVSGPQTWKDKFGKTLKEIEEQKATKTP